MRSIRPNAGPLRQNMTDAEKVMWSRLRNRRLSGFKFKRQWTIGSHVVDFCCIERRLVIEIDGGQHTPERDARRTRSLNRLGYRVVRYWNNDVLQNVHGVLTDLLAKIETHPHPGPLRPAGEGV
jgi:very-short-patch-repair endonuclease